MLEKTKNTGGWQPNLLPGETILWSGQPVPGVNLQWIDIYAIPFSIFWLFSLISMIAVPVGGNRVVLLPMSCIFIPFVAFGVHFSLGRFVLQYFQYRRTRYFVTNIRVHILTKTWFHYHDSLLDLNRIPMLARQRFHSKVSDILFEPPISGRPSVGFYRLKDAAEVYRLLVELTTRAGAVPSGLEVTGKQSHLLNDALLPDEKIIWHAKPIAGWIFGVKDLLIVPFCLIIGGIQIGAGITWYLDLSLSANYAAFPGLEWTPPFTRYLGLVAAGIGVYLVFGQYVQRYFRKRRTEYTITNRRILALDQHRLWSLPLNRVPKMKKRLTSILFEPKLIKPIPVLARGKIEIDLLELNPGFYGIRDSLRVYNLIRLAVRMQPPPAMPP